jgi:hypothetical protein
MDSKESNLAFSFTPLDAWHLGAMNISPFVAVQFSHRLAQAATIARYFIGKTIAPAKPSHQSD